MYDYDWSPAHPLENSPSTFTSNKSTNAISDKMPKIVAMTSADTPTLNPNTDELSIMDGSVKTPDVVKLSLCVNLGVGFPVQYPTKATADVSIDLYTSKIFPASKSCVLCVAESL
jgi:hypothetical protein